MRRYFDSSMHKIPIADCVDNYRHGGFVKINTSNAKLILWSISRKKGEIKDKNIKKR